MSLYSKALVFAATKHTGQKRIGGENYIIHPIRVSQEVDTEKQKVIALLHDILEDTVTSYDELLNLFGPDVADAVLVLTRRKGESNETYIARVKKNPDAVKVKIADMCDNLADSPSKKAILKYAYGINELLKFLSENS
jgi:(p)ppGpp synthase/HD superfamily hydrolase